MDSKVREILVKVKESAIDAGRSAGKVAGELVNQAKLNIRIIELNSEIETAYKNLGKILYAVHNGVEIPADSIDDTLAEIDGKKSEISIIRDELQKAKAGVTCPVCGKYVGKKALFCSACGTKLNRDGCSDSADEEPAVVPAADGCCDGEEFEEPDSGAACESDCDCGETGEAAE